MAPTGGSIYNQSFKNRREIEQQKQQILDRFKIKQADPTTLPYSKRMEELSLSNTVMEKRRDCFSKGGENTKKHHD